MENVRILIVEDEPLVATLIERQLQFHGYNVAGVEHSGRMALAVLESLHPDLILLDINLADELDGIEVARAIDKNFKIAFVFITGYSNYETIQRADKTNPAAYLNKPFSDTELVSTIETVLNQLHFENK